MTFSQPDSKIQTPTYPYFENPAAWSPHQTAEPGQPLTHLDSLYWVIAPQGHNQIQSYEEYQDLLANRVNWMIQQWMTDQLVEMPEVHQMLTGMLNDAEIPQFYTPNQEEATPLVWARALVESPWMSSHWTLEIQPEYPIPMESDPAEQDWIITAIQEQTLEEWVLGFTKV